MIVVDTNVVAYRLIEDDRTADAQALRLADTAWRSEPFLLVEFSNLLATQLRAKALSAAQAKALLESAAKQVAAWVEVPHAEALAVAVELQVSAYDARFVACARRRQHHRCRSPRPSHGGPPDRVLHALTAIQGSCVAHSRGMRGQVTGGRECDPRAASANQRDRPRRERCHGRHREGGSTS
jgi:predicted nucleic acid-binding protein